MKVEIKGQGMTELLEMWESESVHEAAAFRAVGHSLSVGTCFPRSMPSHKK